jgi:uncharacterized membrane protein YqjE
VEYSGSSASTVEPAAHAATGNPLNAIRLLRVAGALLFNQASLHGQLARVEWAEEKGRLLKMLVTGVFGLACMLCLMLFVGLLVIAMSWDTVYRVPAALGMLVAYVLGIGVAWHRLQSLSLLGSQSFAATREELAADIALIKSRL